jgi:NTP pyrophosphatase (non-canonical NTP hydrolase)
MSGGSPLISKNVTLHDLQEDIRSKDHRPELKQAYFLKLVEEVGELAEVIRKDQRMQNGNIKGTIEEELYDVLYYVAALANAYDIDLEMCYQLKEELNDQKYHRTTSTELSKE